MKIGYLKNLGRHELEKGASRWRALHKNEKVILESVSYDELEKKIQNNELDAVLVNSRHTIYRRLATYPVDEVSPDSTIKTASPKVLTASKSLST